MTSTLEDSGREEIPSAQRDRRERTRVRIIETTLQLIADHGFAATSTREISERLGLTKAALYYHFRTKDDLLGAIVAPAMGALAELATDGDAALPLSAAARRRVIEGYVDLVVEHADLIGVVANDPTIRQSAPMQQARPLYERLVQMLAGTETPDAVQRARAWAAFGAVHAGLLHARPADDPGTVRAAVLAVACRAFGLGTGRRSTSGGCR